MKKSKILLSILSIAGLGAAIAPVVAMTSCSCSTMTFQVIENDCLDNMKYSIDGDGNLVVTGTFKENCNGFDKKESFVRFETDTGFSNERFEIIEEEQTKAGATYITYGEQNAPKITIYKAYFSVAWPDKKINRAIMTIKGIFGA